MKRILKIAAVTAALCLIALSLTSCSALDELRNTTAHYCDDTHATLEFRGVRYRETTGTNAFVSSTETNSWGVVTDPDVPVLLSREFGNSMWWNQPKDAEDHIPIALYTETIDKPTYSVLDQFTTHLYCPEDRYDELNKLLNEKELDCYYIDFFDSLTYDRMLEKSNYTADLDEDDFQVTEIVNDKLSSAIDRTLNNKDILMHEELSDARVQIVELKKCDASMTVYDTEYSLKVCEYKGKYFLSLDDQMYYNHIVSKDDKALFDAFFEKYESAIEEDYIS